MKLKQWPSRFLLAMIPDLLVRTDIPQYLQRLMSRDLIGRHLEIKEEKRISIEFADAMRKKTLLRQYRGVWTTVANEGHKSALMSYILRAMGMIPGAADFVFTWPGGSGWIELKAPEHVREGRAAKVPAGKQSPNQLDFEYWCRESTVPYAICFSAEEAVTKLTEWGAL